MPHCVKLKPTPVSFPGESHAQRSLVGTSAWGHKELDKTDRLLRALNTPSVKRPCLQPPPPPPNILESKLCIYSACFNQMHSFLVERLFGGQK